MNTAVKELLDTLERLHREATPGPLTVEEAICHSQREDRYPVTSPHMPTDCDPEDEGPFQVGLFPVGFDADLFATMRNALPELLEGIRGLEAEVSRLGDLAEEGETLAEDVRELLPRYADAEGNRLTERETIEVAGDNLSSLQALLSTVLKVLEGRDDPELAGLVEAIRRRQ